MRSLLVTHFKEFRIGKCSNHWGKVTSELNLDASTGTPGSFRCVFECRTKDCGKAEERVFQKLAEHRRGKWGQEFFEVGLDHAKESIIQVCATVDTEITENPQPQNNPKILNSVKSESGSSVGHVGSPPASTPQKYKTFSEGMGELVGPAMGLSLLLVLWGKWEFVLAFWILAPLLLILYGVTRGMGELVGPAMGLSLLLVLWGKWEFVLALWILASILLILYGVAITIYKFAEKIYEYLFER